MSNLLEAAKAVLTYLIAACICRPEPTMTNQAQGATDEDIAFANEYIERGWSGGFTTQTLRRILARLDAERERADRAEQIGKTTIAMCDTLTARVEVLEGALKIIAEAKPSEWEHGNAGDFQAWAQNRAQYALHPEQRTTNAEARRTE